MRALAVFAVVVAGCSGSGEQTGIRGCPAPDWPGPWTACAEARWVERVTEAAGYTVVGDTGSALIAEGRGHGFYIWATGSGAHSRDPRDDGVRTSWTAQGITVWIESGPRSTDAKPPLDDLGDLVAASRRIRPPDPR